MVKKRCSRILVLTVFAALFVFAFAWTAFADDSDTVIYDAANFSNLNGRTQSDVMEQYTQAQAEGTTYIDGVEKSYYQVPASISAPYAAGVLTSDTLKAMKGMSNFYRWLIGVNNISVNSASNASLQAQALDRNFEFDHHISQSSKPEDMDDALWQEGFTCTHNILAWNYEPSDAITGWMNEGYRKSDGTWDTVGHRRAILDSDYSTLYYGFSGRIAIGKIVSSSNTFTNAFAAFPAAGYMPAKLLTKSRSAWTVELNTNIVRAQTPANVQITVKNLSTGASYTCQNSDNTANNNSRILHFMQPQDASGSYYSGSYQVTATGLTDVATGKPAEIRYTVNFFTLPEITSMTLSKTQFAFTGNQIKPEVTVKGSQGVLTEGQDYTVAYYNNINEGTGIVEVKGIGNYCGTLKKSFTIEVDRKDMEQCSVTLSPTSGRYTGDPIKPTVTVKSFGNTLTQGEDYEVSYRNNVEPGTGVVTVSGIGEYSGSAEKTFTIYKGTQSVSASLSARTLEVGGTGTITVTARYEDPEISLSSTDESVATVDQDGTIHVLKEGTFRIRIAASETEHYDSGSWNTVVITGSKDIHTMVDADVVYATDENETATVTRTCAVCGKTETTSFTTVRTFYSFWYWKGSGASTYINPAQTEGAVYTAELYNYAPSDAENTEFVLQSSDPNVMTVNGDSFTFVGAGTVTLTIYAKYRPTTIITKSFTVSHVWDEGVVTRASTCCVKGEKKYTCTKCGAAETRELALDPNNHTGETVFTGHAEATCCEAGYTGDTRCAGCNAILESGEAIPVDPSAHDWAVPTYVWSDDNSTVTAKRVCKHNDAHKQTEDAATTHVTTKDATCSVTGVDHYKSAAFENDAFAVQEKDVTTPKLPHPWNDGTVTKTPTCSEEGEMYYECTACDATKTEPIAKDKNAHDWDAPTYVWSDDNSTVTAKRVCKHNDAHKQTEDAATTHETTKTATCTETGTEHYTSAAFENSAFAVQEKDVTTPKLTHPWNDGTVTKTPTCSEEGEIYYECTACDATKTEPIAKDTINGHRWNEGVVTTEPKCNYAGVRTFTCELCEKTYTEAIDKTEHTPGEMVIENEVPATCTADGKHDETVYCSVCGAVLSRETKTVPSSGHRIEHIPAVTATCAEAGNSEYWYCSECDKFFADELGNQEIDQETRIIPAAGHKWDAGVITTAPTATKTGVKTFTCTVCGATKEEAVPARNNQVASDGTKVGAGASEEVANKAITGMKTDSDPAGSAFRLLRAKSTKQGQTYVTVSWSKVKGAKKYVIYGNACGKTNKMKKLATVTGSYYTVKKVITNKGKKVKVRKGTYYKFIVVALNGSRNVVSTSKVIHVATTGGKVGNDKVVTTKAKKNKVTVKVGKTFYLGAKAVPVSKKKTVKRHRGLAYETTNKAVATVTAKGTIVGKKKGTCSVYVYAQNGICKRISVTVK